ncbi:protein-tyrosine phosphatase family protein [Pyrolobus fumarii]|nr:dual specificity protein phosphatase family protein [Pyrolobus fumarii]
MPWCGIEELSHRYPVLDFSVKPWESIVNVLCKVLELLEEHGKVAICCECGCGRTGMVASADIAIVESVLCKEAMRVFSRERGMLRPEARGGGKAVCRLISLAGACGRRGAGSWGSRLCRLRVLWRGGCLSRG